MSEYKPFYVTIDGEDKELTEDNHTIAQFRHEPEYDYIAIHEQVGPPDAEETKHTLVFRQRWLCLWMGRIALTQEDRDALEALDEQHGPFFAHTGFNSKVLIEDRANEFEKEFYTQSLLTDLNSLGGVPEDWSSEGDSN